MADAATKSPDGLAGQAAALAAGDVTSAQLVADALDRIAAAQPTLNAFRVVRDDAARQEAAEADRRLAAGERLPLLGVPVAVKDDMDVAGEPTSFGCSGTFAPKEQDGGVARRLREAGAVIVGKTNTPEFGQWPFTEGGFGATRNPWNTDHTPGGSSGGSAAAVAAGLVPAAVGSDGAGSIRIPAAWTGLVGIKPQRGRVSTWPDPEAFHGLTCYGPLARTVADAALLLDVLTGSHPEDRHRPPAPDAPFAEAAERRDPGRLRIALSLRIPFSGTPARLRPEVRAAVTRLAATLEGLGHEVVERDPAYGLVGLSFVPRSTAGVREWLQRVEEPHLLDARTRENARTGALLGGPLLHLARAAEGPLRARMTAIFRDVDVVLAPTTAKPPPRIGAIDGKSNWQTDRTMIAACPYAWPWNVVGLPAVNVPAGLTDAGLPVGAQLIGPANAEARLIGLAAQLEDVERWHERRPPER
jgi:amidase